MTDADSILMMFQTNYGVVLRQVEGISDEEALIQPPYFGNCLNWVLGHIIGGRDRIHSLLNLEPIWSDEDYAPYKRGSSALVSGEQTHFSLERLLADYGQSQAMVAAALQNATPTYLAEMVGDSSRGKTLTFLAGHEGYHVGQTDILRQVAGKNDQVIK